MLRSGPSAEQYRACRACQSGHALQQLAQRMKSAKHCCQGPQTPLPPLSLPPCLPQGPCQPPKSALTSCMVSALRVAPLYSMYSPPGYGEHGVVRGVQADGAQWPEHMSIFTQTLPIPWEHSCAADRPINSMANHMQVLTVIS